MSTEQVTKTVSVALMAIMTVILTMEMYFLQIKRNGLIRITTDTGTITTLILSQLQNGI